MSKATDIVSPDHAAADHDDHHDHHIPKGLMRWVLTTNHKDIGTLYLWFAFIMFLTGGAMAMVIRAELFQPGLQIVDPNFFNQMTTVHGLIMVFGAVMPAFTGLANWLVPMMIGAPDMALPRMNNWSFWILPFAFSICWHHCSLKAAVRLSAGRSTHRFLRPTVVTVPHCLCSRCTSWVSLPLWARLT